MAGGYQSHRGPYFTVEQARLYTLPDETPPLLVAAKGSKAMGLAGRIADGLIGVAPDRDALRQFEDAGGSGKPRYGQVHVCWAEDEAQARKIARDWWPNASLPGELGVELALPRHFEQAAELVSEDDVAGAVVCGPDPERHLEAIRQFTDAGYDHVYVHQIGPDQEGMLRFDEQQVLPKVG